jgi:hypothetical protein
VSNFFALTALRFPKSTLCTLRGAVNNALFWEAPSHFKAPTATSHVPTAVDDRLEHLRPVRSQVLGRSKANFLERRKGEVRLSPHPMSANFSGSCIVTSRNSLTHNGATTATKSERFGAEWVPACCCRVLTVASDGLLATANFGEFLFYDVR